MQNEIHFEHDYRCFGKSSKTVKFASIYVPYPTLEHYADMLGIRMPLEDNDEASDSKGVSDKKEVFAAFRKDRKHLYVTLC